MRTDFLTITLKNISIIVKIIWKKKQQLIIQFLKYFEAKVRF